MVIKSNRIFSNLLCRARKQAIRDLLEQVNFINTLSHLLFKIVREKHLLITHQMIKQWSAAIQFD